MFEQRTAVFLVNLVQDVNILRPLMSMAARDFDFRLLILVSAKFANRDLFGIWREEIETLRKENGARVEVFEHDWDAFRHLKGGGIIFAGSESNLPGHSVTHAIFRYAPPTFLKVTLQHGFECVGFRHSGAHDRAHGKSVSFGADILCSWQPSELQGSMPQSQRAKAVVTGPSAVLQAFTDRFERDPKAPGIVCENLHSVRLNSTSGLKDEFVGTFEEYCRLLARDGREVVIRPHPGGQYMLKNKVALPANARINNAPMFRLDLRHFAYGISAPSSVLIDMLLADIPTAVWRDRDGGIDSDNYAGLASVSTPQDWLDFSREAALRPEPFIERQRTFLADQRMPIEPRDVFERFAAIFKAGNRLSVASGSAPVERQRLLIIANAHLPTVQVCLERPLSLLVRSGELVTELLTETRLREREAALGSPAAVIDWIERTLDRFAPDALIFSRYSGPYGPEMVAWARAKRIPVVYHLDDDLLSVPKSLGERKHAYHNAPARLEAVRALLSDSDLVYASTERLKERLLGHYPDRLIVTGPINCSGRVIRTPANGPARILGYMASADHLPNLQQILPAIVTLLDRHPQLTFELFGSIPIPAELERFGERVLKVPPIPNYETFLQRFGERGWDIGICPLVPTDFNLTKSNNKWIEYTSLGIAVVASDKMIYDECCADGCGALASGPDEWLAALERLVTDDGARLAMVERAQHKLETNYSISQHRQQILDVVELARSRVEAYKQADSEIIEEVS
jgi:glycosyltransferase involved in cell wall biosynthesis